MRRTVLLVEDEEKIADVLAEQLGEEGLDVRQAHSLRQALRMLDELVPDVGGHRHRAARRLGSRRPAPPALRRRSPRQRHAGAPPDRAHRGGRRPAGVRARRRRLPAQAVRAARADRPRARAARARAARARRHPRRRSAAGAGRAPRELGGRRAPALGARVRPPARAGARAGRGALEGRPPARGLAHARDAADAHRRLAREPAAAQARRGRRARRIRSSTSGGAGTASKSLVRSRRGRRQLPLEARLSVAVARRDRARARGDRPARRRADPRPRRQREPRRPRAHALRLPCRRSRDGEMPQAGGTRFAWIDGARAGGDAAAPRGRPRRTGRQPRHARRSALRDACACSPPAAAGRTSSAICC